MSTAVVIDRVHYAKLGRGHADASQAFTAAGTATDVITGETNIQHKVDRVIIANTGTNPVSVHLEDGGTQKGPLIRCPANDTKEVVVILDFDKGAGVDIEVAGSTPTCNVYLDYHKKEVEN